MVDSATSKLKIVILGAGITGLTAAWRLSQLYHDKVVLLEKESTAGGLAATFKHKDFSFDMGSHRLHEGYEPEVAWIIKELCGDELLRRERRGLIFIKDKPLRYPPSAWDIAFAFGARDFARFTGDFIMARLSHFLRPPDTDNFESFTIRSVGKSLYERFYKPYAIKLWRLPPYKISKDPAVSRVRKFTVSALYRDLKKRIRRQAADFYYYPAQGIGHLANQLQQQFLNNGGRLLFLNSIEKLSIKNDRRIEAVSLIMPDGQVEELATEVLISTVPLDGIHHLVRLGSDADTPPKFDLRWRGLRLLYLITEDKLPSDHETFYFPEPHILFGRVSELTKYSPALNRDPRRAALTIEIPCSYNDDIWNRTDADLAAQCIKQLQELKILRAPAVGEPEFFSRRIKNVYPVYELGWRERFDRIYRRLNTLDNLYMIGRTALFLHCNIDHCMSMAIKLAQYISDGYKDKTRWQHIEQDFFNYRVRE